jgi:hypothetical protein
MSDSFLSLSLFSFSPLQIFEVRIGSTAAVVTFANVSGKEMIVLSTPDLKF